MGKKTLLPAHPSSSRRAILVNFDAVFHNSEEHFFFSADNAFYSIEKNKRRFRKAPLAPDEFRAACTGSEKEAKGANKRQSFLSLAPLAESPRELLGLMLEIDKRPSMASNAARGNKASLWIMRKNLALSKLACLLKAAKYLGLPSLPEKEAFAKNFQGYFGGSNYTYDDTVEMDTPFGKMPFTGLVLTDDYEPLMRLNKPIAGAYRQLSALKDSATVYFSTQGSSTFAGMIASAWSVWIDILLNSKDKLTELFQQGVLDASSGESMPFKINVPTDLRLLETDKSHEDRLFSNHQVRDRLFGIEQGNMAEHLRLVSEREKLPYENIWLLDGSYNRQAAKALRRSGFGNLVVVENNPNLAWNYNDARRNGVRVLGMESLAGDLAAMMLA